MIASTLGTMTRRVLAARIWFSNSPLYSMVLDQPAGNRRIYRADPDGVAALRAQLDRFWSQALATFKEVVEQDNEEVS